MSKLVAPDRPLVIPQALSFEIGIDAALLLQQIHYWQQRGELKEDGFKWFYKTFKQWTQELPLSMRAVKAGIAKLKALGLIKVERKSAKNYYQANWYTVAKEAVAQLWQSICSNQTNRCDRSDHIDAIAPDTSITKNTSQKSLSTDTPPHPPKKVVAVKKDKKCVPTTEELKDAENQLEECRINPDAVRRELLKQFANFTGAIARTQEALSQGWCNNPTGVFKKALKLGTEPDSASFPKAKLEIPQIPPGLDQWCRENSDKVKDYFYSSTNAEWRVVYHNTLQRSWSEVMEITGS